MSRIDMAVHQAHGMSVVLQQCIDSPEIASNQEMDVLFAAVRLNIHQAILLSCRNGFTLGEVALKLGLTPEQITAIEETFGRR